MAKLTEEEIRPAELMVNQRIASLADLGRMLSRCQEFVFVSCPACGREECLAKFEKNGINYVECTACETFYINPRPSSKVLDWFYRESPNYAYWNNIVFPTTESARREKIFIPRVNRLLTLCKKHRVATKSLLEIGAGFGTFCSEIKTRNVFTRIVAVEPTPDLADTCRKRGLDVLETPVEDLELSETGLFDVVVSFEVIEHLFAPNNFIGHMKRLLKSGGLLVTTCPNGQGFDVEILGKLSDTVDHEHLNYFNPSSLAELHKSHGLDVLECFTPGELDTELVRNKVLEGVFSLSGQPFLEKVLIDQWDSLGQTFQQYLIDHGLSSNLWIVAQKPTN